ncbi:MAG: hypothetical protein ABIF10_07875 [Candidatus Woesearchaeota archaeon]
MVFKKCNWCKNKVPVAGQCNKCGFVDGLNRKPTDAEFKAAHEVNNKNNYKQFKNLDMLLDEALKD